MLPAAGAELEEEEQGRARKGNGGAAGRQDRGHTRVRAYAVRNLPAAPPKDILVLFDISLGSSWEVIEGRVRAGKKTTTLDHGGVSMVTRSKFLTCRISLCVEPYDELHHLRGAQDADQHSDCKSASAENGYVEIGRACVAVHELLHGGKADWFEIKGLGSTHGTEVLLELHYAPEGADFPAHAPGLLLEAEWLERSQSSTQDSSDFTDGDSGSVSGHILPLRIRPEAQKALELTGNSSTHGQRCSLPDMLIVPQQYQRAENKFNVDRNGARRISEVARAVQASPRAPRHALRAWKSEALKPGERDKKEEEMTYDRRRPATDTLSDDSLSDLRPDSETSGSVQPPDDEDWSDNGMHLDHEELNFILGLKYGAPLVSENMLKTLKGQMKRDLARSLRVPYCRVEISRIQRHDAARTPLGDGINAEWMVGVRFRNDCKEPERDARRLLHEMVKLCWDSNSFVHRACSTQNLLAVFQYESDLLWQKGGPYEKATKAGAAEADTSEGAGWSGLRDGETLRREIGEKDTHGGAFMHGLLYGTESEQTRPESYHVLDVVSEIHKMEARTWTVSKTNSTADCSSICAALAKCKPGDTVVIGSGEYHEDLCLGVDRISLLAASEIAGYGHLNSPCEHFANACTRLPIDEVLLDSATPSSVLQMVVKKARINTSGDHQHPDNDQSTERGAENAVIVYGDANFDSPALYSTSRGVIIAGIQICHTGKAGREAAAVLVADGDAHFRNVIVSRSAGTGVSVERGASTFSRCAFVGCNGVGLESKQHGYVRIEKCLVADCEKGGILIASDRGVLFRLCCVHANRGPGITDTSLTAHDAGSVFEANVIRDNQGGGVLARGASSGKFVRNTLARNREAEIMTCDASSASFEGNRLQAAVGNGILIDDDSKPRLFGNEVRACQYAGIEVRGRASPSLDRNVIRDGATSGLCLAEDAGGHYQDNKIINNQHVGVHITGRANMTFESNTVESNGWAGMSVCII
jgi:parallel beta-helix repeat protein